MTNEQLVALIKNGENVGENMLQLWQQCSRFIHCVALHYQGSTELEDLEQEGYLALYDAVDGFNPEDGYKFLTYAKHWIRQRMQRYIQNNGTVRIPVYECEKLREYRKLMNAYRLHFGKKPTRHEIATQMSMPYKMVVELEKAAQMAKLRSLDSLLSVEEDSVTVGDMVPGDVDVEGDALEIVQQEQLKAVLWPLVDALPEEQAQVLRQRYQENKTLKATGESLGITVEQTRQAEAKAMRSLRCSRNARLLKPFLDDNAYSMGITGTGYESFNRTWTSSTERVALIRCEESIKR